MKDINHLFEKYKSVAVKEIQKRTFVSDIIKKEIGQDIPIEHISFVGGVVKVKTTSIIKNQIFIKKQLLIKSILKKIDISDIQ